PTQTNTPPSSRPIVWINEWMANNSGTLLDPATSGYEDWFELYNPDSHPVDLSGCTLTDDLRNPAKWMVPAGTVLPAGGFLLVWADERPALNNGSGALHANFKLSQGGESIGLFAPDGALIDAVDFGPQQPDRSEGRPSNDPAARVDILSQPTPGQANLST